LASIWVASDWLMAKNLPVETVAQVFTVMGAVTALQFVESIDASGISTSLWGEKSLVQPTTL
jgi:hypothetical protein